MTSLKHTRGQRGPSSLWKPKPTSPVTLHPKSPNIELRLSLPVPGGRTEVRIEIGEKDYSILLEAMAKANQEAALHAMATVSTIHLGHLKESRDRENAGKTEKLLSSLRVPKAKE